MSTRSAVVPAIVGFALMACAAPTASTPDSPSSGNAWGPETPAFNLEVILRSPDGVGFGLVKFRQPNDNAFIVYLDTWVRGLAPNTAYRLQRAVDTVLDGDCVSSAWLTLGMGLTPYAITTDDRGTATAALWRAVPPVAGAGFDIHFQVIDDLTDAVVLQSGCYQYTISM